MKKIWFILVAMSTIFVVNYLVFAFFEPTSPPPDNNVPAPINVGPSSQIKQGNLGVASLTLSGVTRSTWPNEVSGGGSCSWSGTRCSCNSTGGGLFSSESQLIMGMTCSAGTITDFRVSLGSGNCNLRRKPNWCNSVTHYQ